MISLRHNLNAAMTFVKENIQQLFVAHSQWNKNHVKYGGILTKQKGNTKIPITKIYDLPE